MHREEQWKDLLFISQTNGRILQISSILGCSLFLRKDQLHKTWSPEGWGAVSELSSGGFSPDRTSLLSLNSSLLSAESFCWLAPVWVVRKTVNSDPSPKGLKLLSLALQSSLPQLFLYLHKHFHVWMRLEDFWDETSGNPDLTWLTKQEEGAQSNWLGRQCTLPEIPDASSFENKEIIIFLIKFRYS